MMPSPVRIESGSDLTKAARLNLCSNLIVIAELLQTLLST